MPNTVEDWTGVTGRTSDYKLIPELYDIKT